MQEEISETLNYFRIDITLCKKEVFFCHEARVRMLDNFIFIHNL